MIDTSPQCSKQLVELVRTLRDRLSDSQGNLKPLSARVIGSLLSVTDRAAQAKYGKLVYGPLINAAMTDIKKPMREASLEALRQSTTLSSIEGGGLNLDALESFVNSIASELNEAAMKVSQCGCHFSQAVNRPQTDHTHLNCVPLRLLGYPICWILLSLLRISFQISTRLWLPEDNLSEKRRLKHSSSV